jgi:uncharacterized YigZ family protein
MYRIATPSEASLTVNHSRFIGFALPCADETQLRAHLARLANLHVQAHHLAFAYRIKTGAGLIARCNDAGEPGGTAGKPILAQISGFEAVDTLVAVVRYFGGVKLGAGGLVRAYGGTARMALEGAGRVPYVELAEFRLTVDYARFQSLEYQVRKAGGEIVAKSFAAAVDVVVRVPAAEAPALLGQFGTG